ncbi:MAG: helix-turn-helix domain-containing protein [Spirochaetota bacterium]
MSARGSIKSQPPGYSFTTERYDMFQVIFVSSGSLAFACGDAGHEAASVAYPGDALVLRLGGAFALSSAETGYGGVCYLDYDASDPRQAGPAFQVHGDDWLVELVGTMQFALANPETTSQEAVNLLARAIAWHALDGPSRSRAAAAPAAAEWADRIRQVVHNTLYADPSELRQGLAALGRSYRQLSRYFTEHTGTTIKQYQIGERVREAKRLLRNTGLTVTDVAHELHYPSSQKFATQFKRVTGESPSEYRRR